jgi:hypothetical protein
VWVLPIDQQIQSLYPDIYILQFYIKITGMKDGERTVQYLGMSRYVFFLKSDKISYLEKNKGYAKLRVKYFIRFNSIYLDFYFGKVISIDQSTDTLSNVSHMNVLWEN